MGLQLRDERRTPAGRFVTFVELCTAQGKVRREGHRGSARLRYRLRYARVERRTEEHGPVQGTTECAAKILRSPGRLPIEPSRVQPDFERPGTISQGRETAGSSPPLTIVSVHGAGVHGHGLLPTFARQNTARNPTGNGAQRRALRRSSRRRVSRKCSGPPGPASGCAGPASLSTVVR